MRNKGWQPFTLLTVNGRISVRRCGKKRKPLPVMKPGADQAQESIANIDGAPWIRNQLELYNPTKRIGLDYYHLKDNVEKARREVYGEENEDGKQWLKQWLSVVLEQGVKGAIDALLTWREELQTHQHKAVDRLLNYVIERREIIAYKEFRANGWQIGSGPTEAQCKTTTLRIKGRGRRWNAANAEGIMALAALDASQLWDSWRLNPYRQAS